MRARACALRASVRSANRNTTDAASDHWPSATAPAAATSMSTWMSRARTRSAAIARRIVSDAPAMIAIARTPRSSHAPAPAHRSAIPASSATPDSAQDQQPLARRRVRDRERLLVLEPRAHARIGDGPRDGRRRKLGGVVLHVKTLSDEVGGKVFEPGKILEPPLDQRDFLAAIHAFDFEGRFGVQLADGARRHDFGARDSGLGARRSRLCAARRKARSSTCSSPCANRPTMCWSSSA